MPEQRFDRAGPRITSREPLQTATPVDIFKALDKMSKDELTQMLEARHPGYIANAGFWRKMGDVGLNRIQTLSDKANYLVQGDSEDSMHYAKRIELSAFLPETPGLIDEFIGAIYSKSAKRNVDGVQDNVLRERLMEFLAAAGMEEQPLAKVATMAAMRALIYGSCDALLDREAGIEQALPQIMLYTPEARLDWQEGRDGHFAWVKYVEHHSEKMGWSGERARITEYRIITGPVNDEQGVYITFRKVKIGNRPVEIEHLPPVVHEFHRIPVTTLYWNKVESGIGEPWIKPLVEADLKAFGQESDGRWDEFVHAHPLILAWLRGKEDDPDGPLGAIKLGTNWATHLDPGNDENLPEKIEYLVPPVSVMELQTESAQRTRELVRRLAGNGSDMMPQGGEPASGVALAYQQAQRSKNFGTLARGLAEWEWLILELVALEGKDATGDTLNITEGIEVQYPDIFDQRLTGELEADLNAAKEIGSPTLVSEVSKRLSVLLLGDGASTELIDEVNTEIDAQDKAASTVTADEGTPTALTLALERSIELGDLELFNAIRSRIAARVGIADITPFTQAQLESAREFRAAKRRRPEPAREE